MNGIALVIANREEHYFSVYLYFCFLIWHINKNNKITTTTAKKGHDPKNQRQKLALTMIVITCVFVFVFKFFYFIGVTSSHTVSPSPFVYRKRLKLLLGNNYCAPLFHRIDRGVQDTAMCWHCVCFVMIRTTTTTKLVICLFISSINISCNQPTYAAIMCKKRMNRKKKAND